MFKDCLGFGVLLQLVVPRFLYPIVAPAGFSFRLWVTYPPEQNKRNTGQIWLFYINALFQLFVYCPLLTG